MRTRAAVEGSSILDSVAKVPQVALHNGQSNLVALPEFSSKCRCPKLQLLGGQWILTAQDIFACHAPRSLSKDNNYSTNVLAAVVKIILYLLQMNLFLPNKSIGPLISFLRSKHLFKIKGAHFFFCTKAIHRMQKHDTSIPK